MKYLHNSPVKLHGNLASWNCMIDSHWVVSITDWGLHDFKEGEDKVDCDVTKMYAGKGAEKYTWFFAHVWMRALLFPAEITSREFTIRKF